MKYPFSTQGAGAAAAVAEAPKTDAAVSGAASRTLWGDAWKRLRQNKLAIIAAIWIVFVALVAITLVAIVIAMDENSVIFSIVSFAWAGFGATFGPLMLFSLFWKRTNRAGAIAGMLGGIWDIYELLPAFLFSSLCIVVVSLLTAPPSKEIEAEFEAVQAGK